MKSLRILNERSGFLGLSVFDLAFLGYTLIILNSVLSKFGLELLSFPIVGLISILLIHIRLTRRPKFIRDFLKFYILPKKIK